MVSPAIEWQKKFDYYRKKALESGYTNEEIITMAQVKAPDVSQPKRGLTDFERKIADILFAETCTNELRVERVLDVAIAIGEGLIKDAVDGVVHHFDGDELAAIHYNDPKGVPMCYYASACGLEAGDKVKLILAKED